MNVLYIYYASIVVNLLDPLVCLTVELAVDGFAVLVNQLEGVRPVAVHVSEAVGCTTVGEQEAHLVGRLRSEADEIPEHVRVLREMEVSKLDYICINSQNYLWGSNS